MTIAVKGNQGDKGVWPSLETASRIADWANIFFIGSLVVGVISTILIVWMANVKEEHWAAQRGESNERIAEANERAAEATKIAEQERLERVKIEERLADRSISDEAYWALIAKLVEFCRTRIRGNNLLGYERADGYL